MKHLIACVKAVVLSKQGGDALNKVHIHLTNNALKIENTGLHLGFKGEEVKHPLIYQSKSVFTG
ncbi:MAG: hypothetical protein RRY61_07325 [Bacteroidales bacterium]